MNLLQAIAADLSDLFTVQATEKAQLYDSGLARVRRRQVPQRFVEGQQIKSPLGNVAGFVERHHHRTVAGSAMTSQRLWRHGPRPGDVVTRNYGDRVGDAAPRSVALRIGWRERDLEVGGGEAMLAGREPFD